MIIYHFWAILGLFWGFLNFCWSIALSNLHEEFSSDLHLYESEKKCIYSERKECSFKYIKAYIPKGGNK